MASEFFRVVRQTRPHKDVVRRGSDVKPKVLKKGNTTIKIYSHLAHMTKEEQKEWYESEWEKGNPTLKNIVNAVKRCLDEEGK